MLKQTSAILLIEFSNSNVLFTLTSLEGKILTLVSTGYFKTKGAKKTTINSIKSCFVSLNKRLQIHYKLHIKFKGVSKQKRLLLKILTKNLVFPIISFCDVTTFPHNGVKLTKPRRV